MKVKRYLVQDLPEAVQKIRAELGSDAVILNTKEIRVGGFLGMFRKKRVEVIAAVDEQSAKPKPAPSRGPIVRPADNSGLPPPAAPKAKPPMPEPFEAVPENAPSFMPPQAVRDRYHQGAVPRGSSQTATLEPAAAVRTGNAENRGEEAASRAAEAALEMIAGFTGASRPTDEASIEARTASAGRSAVATVTPSQADEKPKPSRTAASSPIEDETASLLQELRAMKEMMREMNRQQTFRVIPEPVLKLSKQLAEQGVEPALVERFAENVIELLEGSQGEDPKLVYEKGREVLRGWLMPSAGQGISATTRIVNFVGPTGVGKTTTIAKLAADQAFVHRRTVGFLTADTYRIAAVDQLRTYAEILNVPLEVVFSASELPKSYKKLEDRDLIFMDTAGRNYRNEMFVSEVNALLAPGEQSENILVLSLTHKYQDMKQVAGQFAKYGVKRLLFTKMDETDSFGSILNLVMAFDYEISYVTCGQTVPDDIRNFDPEDLIHRLLGELQDE
ncbi:flagellar biosynthesis protein FlhF [Cohnella thailandensis]|uniref:Flagellar biosynthesis protein FlhF n=1 Tax=Cohnella thailandensis TaxID=557557 RepID=A0A841T0X2_9BACL|nr:flagellar biosynthesis protein FlhF [Cohnella thailandensis]MBB6636719.1 flagellar biosynthesis protein FlhF [Cohnella thailandensis]MBP1973405.1 flagellar biosynthesis protein FlhF [Cohnella thailandensis]